VLQCGADCLAGDPLGGFNLTTAGLASCAEEAAKTGLPLLVLGGGGYHAPNTARAWTVLTAGLLGVGLDEDIPDCDPHFTEYGPDFTLSVTPGLARNQNTEKELQEKIDAILSNLKLISKPDA